MQTSGKRALKFLETLSFTRCGGTKEEHKAAQMIKEEVESFGGKAYTEEFTIPFYEELEVEFSITEPYVKSYNATIYGMSGSTIEEGIEKDFLYVGNATMIEHMDVKDKIVLLNERVSYKAYKQLNECGVAGFITFSGMFDDDNEKTDIDVRILRHGHTKYGEVPGITIRVADALEIVQKKATKAKLLVKQDMKESTSMNVIAEIKGEIDEEIIFCGHYDSVEYSKGAYDNGAGSVIIMEIMRHFQDITPKRTMKFVWFGAEERGLLGSKDYVKRHKEELKNIKLVVNVDMAGVILGQDCAIVSADLSLKHMVDLLGKELGFSVKTSHDVYSSDSTPFAFEGVPAISFARFSARGGAMLHNRQDVFSSMDGDSLENTINFIKEFSDRINNSVYFPVPRDIPENIQKKLKEYMDRSNGILKEDKKKEE